MKKLALALALTLAPFVLTTNVIAADSVRLSCEGSLHLTTIDGEVTNTPLTESFIFAEGDYIDRSSDDLRSVFASHIYKQTNNNGSMIYTTEMHGGVAVLTHKANSLNFSLYFKNPGDKFEKIGSLSCKSFNNGLNNL